MENEISQVSKTSGSGGSNGGKPVPASTWAMACHLSGLAVLLGVPFGNILGPLVVWLITRDKHPVADRHGKEALNFQISFTIYFMVAFLSCFFLVGFVLVPVLGIAWIVFIIKAAVYADRNDFYRYPLTFRFIR